MNWCLWAACLILARGSFAAGNAEADPRLVAGRRGGSALLGCDLLKPDEASPPLYVIEWLRWGSPLPIFIKFGLYSPRVDPDFQGRVQIQAGASLQINQLRVEDQGWYECRVLFLNRPSGDDEFQNSTWINLIVNSPPVFQKTPPALIEVQVQAPLTLTCLAAGNPRPLVSWKKGNRTIQSQDNLQVKNETLFFVKVERTCAGLYTCHATNEEGAVSHMTRLLVQGPPVIVAPPQNVTVNRTQDAFMSCRAEAYPANLTYNWFWGRTNVFHLSHLQSRIQILIDGSLLVQRTTPEDSGKYTCVPSNGLRRPPSASAFLTVLYPAQASDMPPETLLPIGMLGVIRCPCKANPPLLSVSWSRDGRPLELGKFPGWSMKADGAIAIANSNEDALGVYACTPYNSYGTAGSSASTRVLLKDPPVFALRPKDEYFQDVGRELLIPCAAQGDPSPVISWTKIGSRTVLSAQVDQNHSLLLRPLTKEQHGSWECAADNGVARISAITAVYVLGTSPHAVGNISAWPLQQAVNVSWQPGFDGGYLQRFSIWFSPVLRRLNRPYHDWVSRPVPAGATYILVENLQPDTSYQFSILAENKFGSGPFSQIISAVPQGFEAATVPPALPTPTSWAPLSPPQSLRCNETKRGVLLLWEPPTHSGSPPTSYTLEVRQDKGRWEVLSGAIPSSETQFLALGLIKDSLYEFRLVAVSGSYHSAASNVVNISTAGMEVYPSRTQLPEVLPHPLLAGVIGGVCFLSTAVIFSTMAACVMNQRRAARLHKRRQDLPIGFSSTKKLLPARGRSSTGTASPDSVLKLKFPASPYQSLRHTILWGGRAGHHLSLELAGSCTTHSALYESHVEGPLPLERISRGPDGRFVVQNEDERPEGQFSSLERPSLPCRPSSESSRVPLEPHLQTSSPVEEPLCPRSVHLRPKNASHSQQEARVSGYRHGRYFGYSSSSLAEEAKPLRIADISPVATVPYGATQETQRCLDTDGFPPPSPPGQLGSPSPGRSPNSQAGGNHSAPSGILQYLSLPFFKEMNVDGNWPPDGSEMETAPLGQPVLCESDLADGSQLPPAGEADRTASPIYMDLESESSSIPDQPSAGFLLEFPDGNKDPAEAPPADAPLSPLSLSSDAERTQPPGQGSWLWTQMPSQTLAGGHRPKLPGGAAPSKARPPLPEGPRLPAAAGFPQGHPVEKLPRGSLTSESSGRGSGSFLKPPSSAPSPAGSYLSSPFGDVASCRSSAAGDGSQARQEPVAGALGKRKNPSVDESYEWDSEFALEADLLDALQVYRSGDPRRPVSTIAAHELAKQSSKGSLESCSTSPSNSQSVSALGGSSSPPSLTSPEARCAALREEFLAYRRRREMIQQRWQKTEPSREAEQATLF